MTHCLYNLFIRNLFSFKGRTSRKEYIARFITVVVILFILKLNAEYKNPNDNWFFIITLGLFAILAWISIFQYFPLAVRRLHDLNASGWYVLISFIPFGQLLILWLMFKKGTNGPNKYGTSSDNYNERDTSLKYNLLVFGVIIALILLIDSRITTLHENQKYGLLATKLATEYYKRKDYDNALENFDLAIDFTPEDPSLYMAKGDVLLKLHRYDEALIEFDHAIKEDNSFYKAHANKGMLLVLLNNHQDAIVSLNKALALEPNNKDNFLLYAAKAKAFAHLGQNQEAIASAKKSISLNKNPINYKIQGTMFGLLKDYQKAIDSYNKAIELKPDHIETYVNKLCPLLKLGRYQEVMETADKILELDPKNQKAINAKEQALKKTR
jgi:tetratricopeptide (TPR) repeat protein